MRIHRNRRSASPSVTESSRVVAHSSQIRRESSPGRHGSVADPSRVVAGRRESSRVVTGPSRSSRAVASPSRVVAGSLRVVASRHRAVADPSWIRHESSRGVTGPSPSRHRVVAVRHGLVAIRHRPSPSVNRDDAYDGSSLDWGVNQSKCAKITKPKSDYCRESARARPRVGLSLASPSTVDTRDVRAQRSQDAWGRTRLCRRPPMNSDLREP